MAGSISEDLTKKKRQLEEQLEVVQLRNEVIELEERLQREKNKPSPRQIKNTLRALFILIVALFIIPWVGLRVMGLHPSLTTSPQYLFCYLTSTTGMEISECSVKYDTDFEDSYRSE